MDESCGRGCGYNLLTFETNFECNRVRLNCICNCSLEEVISSISICGLLWNKCYILRLKKHGNGEEHGESTGNFIVIGLYNPTTAFSFTYTCVFRISCYSFKLD